MGGGIPKESDFEACWDLIAGLRRDWGRQGLHNAMRLEMNYREKNVKDTNTWRLNYTLLNDQEITEEIKEEIKKYLETNYNENTMIQNYRMQQKQF